MRSSTVTATLAFAGAIALASPAHAFCGFFVGKADGKLFNQSSQVAIVRDANRTVITMGNDFKGEMDEFALVVPVPSVLTRDQIHVGERRLLERLDAYSAPRLVEYTDEDPCEVRRLFPMAAFSARGTPLKSADRGTLERRALGVTVEAAYTVGEYDIVLLSATQSQGLEIWLRESGYRIPPHASAALAPYIRQQMKFFVARVNIKEQRKTDYQELRPIQIAFESPKFMLPIRLGMANADGPQDLIVYAMTRNGRVESSNYQTVKISSDVEVPEFVQKEFGDFYKALFARSWREHGQRAIATEYVWNMGFCDPCAANPLTPDELQQLGVFWVGNQDVAFRGGGVPVTLTRLHLRYDAQHFPEDLALQQTGDQQNFQGRYIIRHPWRGDAVCSAAISYREQLNVRHRQQAETLASLTGWDMARILARMGRDAPEASEPPWWKKLWH
jgi:hypothetical protein